MSPERKGNDELCIIASWRTVLIGKMMAINTAGHVARLAAKNAT